MNVNVGDSIRKIRVQKEMSIRQLSEITGMTSSHISQVERGLASPSLSALEMISDAFGMPITVFFSNQEKNTPVVKRTDRERIELDGSVAEALVRMQSNAPFGVYCIKNFNENHVHTNVKYSHTGTEFIYVVKGSIEYHLKDEVYVLEEGDSLCYSAVTAHWGIKRSNELELLVVTSPFVVQQQSTDKG